MCRIPPLVASLLALTLGILALRPVAAPDFWWHLSMGRATWEAGSLTYPDPVALAAAPEYVNIVWLFDVPVYLLHRAGGLVAVNLLIAALAAAAFGACWLLARDVVGPSAPWTTLLVAALAAGGAHLRFIPRPQAVFLLLLPLTMWLARRAARSSGRERWLAAGGLLLTVACWTHVHASVVIAPLVALAAALPWAWGPGVAAGERTRIRWHWGHGLIGLIVAALPLTGASGPELVRRVLAHRDNYSVRHIAEMQPMQAEWWLNPTRDILFCELLLVVGVWGAIHRRRLDPGPLTLALLGLVLTLGTNRFAAAWALLLLPLVATVLRPAGGEGRRRIGLALGAAVGVPALLVLGSKAPSFAVDPFFPAGASRALRTLKVDGPIFNEYGAGGYLGWELYGQVRVIFDSRAQMHFDVEEFYAASQALRAPPVFAGLDAVHGFRAAVVPRQEPLCRALAADPEWMSVWFSQRDAVFVPAGGGAAATLGHLATCTDVRQLERCQEAGAPAEFLAEVDSLLRLTPEEAHLGRLGALLALQCARPPALVRAIDFLAVAAREPENPDFIWLSGLALLAQNQVERALLVLAELPPGHLQGQALRLRILRRLGRAAEALPIARSEVRRRDAECPAALRELLAWACEETGDRDCALREALRAALAGNAAARQRLERYREMGWVPPELETLTAAALQSPPEGKPHQN